MLRKQLATTNYFALWREKKSLIHSHSTLQKSIYIVGRAYHIFEKSKNAPSILLAVLLEATLHRLLKKFFSIKSGHCPRLPEYGT